MTPSAYLIHFREVSVSGGVRRCTIASLDPEMPAIMLPGDADVESRTLVSVTPLVEMEVAGDFIQPKEGQGISDNPYVSPYQPELAMRWHRAYERLNNKETK